MEVAIINHSTNVEQLLSDSVLNFFELAHDIEVGVLLHEILHRLVYLILIVVLSVLLQILVSHASNHIFHIGVVGKPGAHIG